jgi:hypothetical protein
LRYEILNMRIGGCLENGTHLFSQTFNAIAKTYDAKAKKVRRPAPEVVVCSMNIIIPGTNEEPDLNTHKVGAFEALPGGMHSIKGQVAVITGAAGGIGQALALEMAHRGAAGIALVDFSDRVEQVARKINTEAARQVAIAYR